MDFPVFEESARVRRVEQMLAWGMPMRRNDDLLRRLMQDIEADPSPLYVHFTEGDEIEYFHLRLLADEGFLEETGKHGGTFRMTMKGHDFVAVTRSDPIWEKTKAAAAQLSGFSISLLKDVATGYIRQEAVKLGIPFG